MNIDIPYNTNSFIVYLFFEQHYFRNQLAENALSFCFSASNIMVSSSATLATSLLPLLISASPLSKRLISDGPMLQENFPDPAVLKLDNTYYAVATQSNGKHVPLATSQVVDDFRQWSISDKELLPDVGGWSSGKDVWAADLLQLPNGKFVLYYAAGAKDNDKHCVGAATSDTVDGEYKPSDQPIACHTDEGGAIDISGFIDSDNTVYTTYKVDGNSIGSGGNCGNGDGGKATPIMLQKMESDGVTKSGDPQQILDRDDRDGPLIEAPSLSRIQDDSSSGGWLYFLFFSSNCYSGDLYDTSYAVSTNGVGGPYEKAKKPLLLTGDFDGKLYAPGGMDTPIDLGSDNGAVFHADKDKSADTRQMWGANLDVDVGARTISIDFRIS